jgi:hypothetical protein
MNSDLKVIYMVNGLILVGERVINQSPGLNVKRVVGLVPGQKQGQLQSIEAFPFTDLDEVITIEAGSYIAVTEVDDDRLKAEYNNAIKKIREQKSGLILP